MTALDVWWDGALVVTVTEQRRRMACTYTAAGGPMLSVAMSSEAGASSMDRASRVS